MLSAARTVPTDPLELHAEVVRLHACLAQAEQEHAQVIAQRDQRIEQLLDYIALLKRKRFGPSSERVSPDQLGLFDEAELEALIGELEQQAPPPVTPSSPADAPPKTKPVRRPLPEHLPRVERIIDLPTATKEAMGADWHLIGYDAAEQLAIIPRQHYVIRTLRAKYAPRHPEVPGAEQGVIIAPRAPQILPKAIAHSSLLADLVTAKFVDALPLYRQEKIFAREGIALSRQTMAGWLIALDEKLTPLLAAMRSLLYEGRVLHVDETRLQVLDEPGRTAAQQSFMWVYCGGPPGRPVIFFQYADSRSATVPKAFLRGPPGSDPPLGRLYLLSDGYAAYSSVALELGLAGHAACWAHVRRKFVEAAAGRSANAAAHQMVALIGKLYAVERRLKDATPAERQAERAVHSRPLLDAIKTWLDDKSTKALPKGLLGTAISYALGVWPQLTTFLADGHLPIDNNPAENAIRPFVIGRKNWLFSGSPRGAQASATLYSLVESAKANGLEPRTYLGFLFERLPLANTPEAIAALLPQALTPQDIQSVPSSL
jgi:transposase